MNTVMAVVAAVTMSVLPSTPSRTDQVANGVTTQFFFNFKTASTAHVKVFVDEAPVVIGYSVALNTNQDSSPGGSVTFTVAPANGKIVRLERTRPISQDSVWTPMSAFKGATLSAALDNMVMIDQQTDRRTTDAELRVGVLEAGLPAETAARIAADTAEIAARVQGDSETRTYVESVVTGQFAGTGVVPLTWSATGDGLSVRFPIPGSALFSPTMYLVTLSGVTQVPTDDYTVDLGTHEIVFTSAPPLGVPIAVRATGYSLGVNEGDTSLITATGSTTARTLAARFSDAVNVKDYGAKGDGITDDTAAIQAALNVSAPRGKTVVLPRGIYRTTATLNVASNTSIDGSDGAVFRPDASANVPVIWGPGTSIAHLANVAINGLTIDGVNRPADSTGGFGAIWFHFTDGVTIRDLRSSSVHDAVYLRAVTDFRVSDVWVNDARAAVVALLSETKRGTISDFGGTNLAEGIDFFNNEDVTVSGFSLSGNPASPNEAFDISTSRRIVIANGTARGFDRGILMKCEAGAPAGTVVEDYTVRNVTLLDSVLEGIHSQCAVATYGNQRRLRFSGITIKSAVATAMGVYLSPPSGAAGYDATFDELLVDTPGVGFKVNASYSGVRLRNSKITGAIGQVVDLSIGPYPDLIVTGNEVSGTGGTAADAGIYITNADDVRVARNRVSSTVAYGIRVKNSKRPEVRDNSVALAGVHGIYLDWTAASAIDVRHVGNVVGNVVRDWGQGSANRQGIGVNVANVTGAVEALIFAGNTAVLTDAATLNNQYAFSFVLGAATLDRSRFDGNTGGARVPVTAAATIGSTAFGAGCSKASNLPSTM
jgi:parallel beta-helix repeat protein